MPLILPHFRPTTSLNRRYASSHCFGCFGSYVFTSKLSRTICRSVGQRLDVAGGHRLHEDVADRGRLDGAGDDRRSQASAVIWLSSSFWLPPPTMWITLIRSAEDVLQALQRLAVASGRGFRGRCGRTRRGWSAAVWLVSLAELLDLAAACRRARGTACGPGRSPRRTAWRRAGHLRQLGVAVVVALLLPLPAALLHRARGP